MDGGKDSLIILPWPSIDLSPNSRIHWAKKAKAVKVYRKIACWETIVSKQKVTWDEFIYLVVTFHPPDNRIRDMDNLAASMKSANDGIADALRVDDSQFRIKNKMGEVVKGGRVTVEISQYE